MTNSKYSAGLMSQSFWFLEFKKVVRLRQEGLAYEDIRSVPRKIFLEQPKNIVL